uniref:Retrovirus-related Pol polyprotein n=1 Tax=Sipha flava TaxID=143950 RepID=A0A2S2QG08_9HEMI
MTVLQVAAKNGLDIKWSKCQFLKDSIDSLGYRIRHTEVSPSEAKTIAVQKFPLPRSAKAVIQSFLGLTGYFPRSAVSYGITSGGSGEQFKAMSFSSASTQDL